VAALAVRRAEAFVAAHAGEPRSVRELARAAGVSVRSLCRGFQRLRGCGPIHATRRVRLQRVHHDLLTGGPGQRVTDVAMRWGFFHLGRFAHVYQQHFGELPSATRRRSRSDRDRRGSDGPGTQPGVPQSDNLVAGSPTVNCVS
jgi:transcriptional regulator GlxA family with amidase domain